jgi:hypothetical protein
VDREDEAALRHHNQSEKIKMTVNKFELKNFTREEWLAMDSQTLESHVEWLNREYPVVPHTDVGRSFSAVRRMKAEREIGIPINLRTGFAVSAKTGKAANDMTDDEWEEFYKSLSERLTVDHPDLYKRLFSPENSTGRQRDIRH